MFFDSILYVVLSLLIISIFIVLFLFLGDTYEFHKFVKV